MDTATFVEQLAESFPTHYGQRVTYIGEDGDVLVLGHPGRRRSIAAANRMARKVAGVRNLADDIGVFVGDIGTVEKWALPGHSEACPLVKASDAWQMDPEACKHTEPPHVEPGDEIKPNHYCGCEKRGNDEWWIRYVSADTPGAFPVTEVGF